MSAKQTDLFGCECIEREPVNANFGNMHGTDGKDEWLTPPEITRALGSFDLDPCSPINRPWPTAEKHLTILDDGLSREWFGRSVIFHAIEFSIRVVWEKGEQA